MDEEKKSPMQRSKDAIEEAEEMARLARGALATNNQQNAAEYRTLAETWLAIACEWRCTGRQRNRRQKSKPTLELVD